MIRRLALALFAVALLSAASAQPRALDSVLDQVTSPCLAAGPDGAIHLFAVGTVGESWAAIHRAWNGEAWSPEFIVDIANTPFHDPALAVGADGTVHAVWSDDGLLTHAAQSAGQWSVPTVVHDGVGDYAEFPSVAARPDGGAEIAWQTLEGSDIRIAHVSVTAAGEAVGGELIDAFGASGYSVCPQIFLDSAPILCWYEASEGDLVLRVAERIPGPRWRAIPLDELLLIDSNRLPQILLTEMGEWAALWTETIARQDRILLGFGSELGLGEIVDVSPEFKNASPAASVLEDGRFAVAWRAELAGQAEIMLALETSSGWRQVSLTEGLSPASAQPALVAADGQVHAVWISDRRAGGTGRLSHVAVPTR